MRPILSVLILAVMMITPGMSAAASWFGFFSDRLPNEAPVHRLGSALAIDEWLLLGPLPNPKSDQTHAVGLGYEKDYFGAGGGGEAGARFDAATTIAFSDETGTAQTAATRRVAAKSNGVVDLNDLYKMPRQKVAYAFAWIDSPSSQTVSWYLGSGDGIKVWIDGKLAQSRPPSLLAQSCIPRQVQFTAPLVKGRNAVLVKVANDGGDWAFILEAARTAEARRIQEAIERDKVLKEFQANELKTNLPTGFVIPPGAFPKLVWKDHALAEKVLGKTRLKVRWFDANLTEVKRAAAPGRYAAYVEAKIPGGGKLRRAATFFCAEPDFVHALEALPTTTTKATVWATTATVALFDRTYIPNRLITHEVWEEHKEKFPASDIFGTPTTVLTTQGFAVTLAGMSELSPNGGKPQPLLNPTVLDEEYHLRLKQKLLGWKPGRTQYRPPRPVAGMPAPVLRPGTPEEAGMKGGTDAAIRAACRTWAGEGGEPFTALVARRGVVVFHEAFATAQKPATLETRYSLDSITKSVTSILFAQFLDQGLVRLDDPVGKFLPDLPMRGEHVITIHECLSHTSGLEGHGAWGGINNPWMENIVANSADALHPGDVAIYNGMGFDLAGRVMEAISGQGVYRLLRTSLFEPLGMPETAPSMTDLAFTAEMTAEELARLGQVLLNRGSYGNLRFFSPETFELMRPRQAADLFPRLPRSDWEYGLGLSAIYQRDPDAGKNGIPEGATILSRNVFGHGGLATGSLRVDPDNELVIVILRAGGGKDYDKHLTAFLRAVQSGL